MPSVSGNVTHKQAGPQGWVGMEAMQAEWGWGMTPQRQAGLVENVELPRVSLVVDWPVYGLMSLEECQPGVGTEAGGRRRGPQRH